MDQVNIVRFFFGHQIQMKMYHFQTTYYGAHKATDEYLKKYSANFDRFMEVAQGKYGKLIANNIRVEIKTLNSNGSDAEEELNNFIHNLEKIYKYYMKEKALTVIMDEMLADVEQLKYLLKFK